MSRLLTLVVSLALAAVTPLALTAPALAASHGFAATFAGSGTNALASPADVAVDSSAGSSAHDVYVSDPANHRVEKFSASGAFLLMIGKEVNETKVLAAAPEAEQNICTAASLDICKAGTPDPSAGGFETPTFVDVDPSSGPSSGDLYVGDIATGSVQKFDESGHLITSWGAGGELGGLSPLNGIAVDPDGNLFVLGEYEAQWFEQTGKFKSIFGAPRAPFWPSSQNGLAADGLGNLYKIRSSGEVSGFTNTGLGFGEPDREQNATGLAADPSTNDLYVVQAGGFINQFAVNCGVGCTPVGSFGGGYLNGAAGLSIDGASDDVYVANTGAANIAVFENIEPEVTTQAASNIDETSATLNGTIDPRGHGKVTDCYFEYGEFPTYNLGVVPCSQALPYAGVTHVTANVAELQSKVRYQFRLVASNEIGSVATGALRTVVAAGAPSIDGLYSSNITATTAVLHARINPDGVDTKAHFEFGPTADYGERSADIDLGSGEADEDLELELTGLRANLTYYYRVVAENADGNAVSLGQSFSFYPPNCPNRTERQRTGADNVPDCRAYELASAENAADSVLFASVGPNTGRATGPSRLAYVGWGGVIPGAGEQINTLGDLYVATRTNAGWKTKYIGLPGSEAYLMGGPPWADYRTNTPGPVKYVPDKWQVGVLANSDMSRIVDWNNGEYVSHNQEQNQGEGPAPGSSNAPYVWDSTTGQLVDRWPTNVGEIENGENFSGRTIASADLSHFIFSSGVGDSPPPDKNPVGPAFASGGEPGDIYDNNTETGTVVIASLGPNEEKLHGVSPLKASEDGSHILMTTGEGLCVSVQLTALSCGPGELYERVDGAATYEMAPGHAVNYAGMTADGAKAYFTSSEKLVGEDTDESTDLYMWSAEKAEKAQPPLILISIGEEGSGGPGDRDGCSATWTAGCGVEPIVFTDPVTGGYTNARGGQGGNGVSDSSIASRAGDIYFYSPERLVSGKGVTNNQNLYVYRNGLLQFVAALHPGHVCAVDQGEKICSVGPVARMEVSPDGRHMAFITASKVTAYENSGFSAMYSYDPETEQVTCNSCAATGQPATAEVYGSQNGLFMTDDGRTFFSTEEAIVAQDTNASEDVYEFTEGRPQLITSGTAAGLHNLSAVVGISAAPGLAGVSADGMDVFFVTFEHLVGQDQNGQQLKIYDARTNGGFPFVTPPPSCAAAEECHGPGSSPPGSLADGTGAAVTAHARAKRVARKKSHGKRKRHRKHHSGDKHGHGSGGRHG